MSVKDFAARSGHPVDDPESLIRWLDLIPRALNIDDHIEVTSPALADEVDIFNVAAGKRRKVTLTNLLALGGVPANITCTSINFGQTSLSYYGEGTWTPTDLSGAGLVLTINDATYTRVGRFVFPRAFVSYPATASGSAARIGGMPFTVKNLASGPCNCNAATTVLNCQATGGFAQLEIRGVSNANITNAQLSTAFMVFSTPHEV